MVVNDDSYSNSFAHLCFNFELYIDVNLVAMLCHMHHVHCIQEKSRSIV